MTEAVFPGVVFGQLNVPRCLAVGEHDLDLAEHAT
jgi:hypothetical protein